MPNLTPSIEANRKLSLVASEFLDAHKENGVEAHTIGLRVTPTEGMLDASSYRSNEDGIQCWTYHSPKLTDAIFDLWNEMDREWDCLFLIIFTKTGKIGAEFLNSAESEEGMRFPGDVEGEISQFLRIKNQHLNS